VVLLFELPIWNWFKINEKRFGEYNYSPYLCLIKKHKAMKLIYESPIGLKVYDDRELDGKFTITGNAKQSETIVSFESAYDFEELVKSKVKCEGIDFDSEFCQFFAYAKTKGKALAFVSRIEKHFDKVKKMCK